MATITVGDVTPRAQYTATSSQTVFAYTFPIFADGDLKVYIGSTLQTLTTHYTVSGAATSNGGNVTLVTGATAGDVVTIYRDIPVSRTSDYQASGDLLAETLNDDFDKTVMMAQQNESSLSLGLRVDQWDDYGDLTLPGKASRVGKVLAFNATTGDPEGGPTIADTGTVAGISADIATVAGISSDVTTVAADTTDIGTVAANTLAVNQVAEAINSPYYALDYEVMLSMLGNLSGVGSGDADVIAILETVHADGYWNGHTSGALGAPSYGLDIRDVMEVMKALSGISSIYATRTRPLLLASQTIVDRYATSVNSGWLDQFTANFAKIAMLASNITYIQNLGATQAVSDLNQVSTSLQQNAADWLAWLSSFTPPTAAQIADGDVLSADGTWIPNFTITPPTNNEIMANYILHSNGTWVQTYGPNMPVIMPSPTASEISNGYVLSANGTWVAN
jgi:hypothetical protein